MSRVFIRVVPDEVEQYGAAAAIVLAHIRFRCESGGADRIEANGVRWWLVSRHKIGREVGLSTKAIKCALERLGDRILAKPVPGNAGRTLAYRVNDAPTCEKTSGALASDVPTCEKTSGAFVGGQEAQKGFSRGPKGLLHEPSGAFAPLYKELEEGGRSAAAVVRRSGAPEPAPSSYVPSLQSTNGHAMGTRCAKHAHIPDDEWMPENCRDCGAQRKAAKASQADRKSAAIQTIKDCPHCDDLGRVEIVSAGVEQLAPCPRHVSWAQAQEGRTA